MSNFQYVFGNPLIGKKKTKKKLAKVKNKHKLDNKRNPMANKPRSAAQKRAFKKMISGLKKHKKSKKSRNPAYVGYARVKNKKTGHMELKRKAHGTVFAGKAERASIVSTASKYAAHAKAHPKDKKGVSKAKKSKEQLHKLGKISTAVRNELAKMKKAGLHVVEIDKNGTVASTVAKLKALNKGAKVAKKKKTSKKKTGKKKSSGKKRSAKQRANDKKLGLMAKKRNGKKKKSKGKKKISKKSTYKKSTSKKVSKKKVSKKKSTKKSSKRKSYKFTVKRIRRLKKGKTIRLHVGKKSKKQKRYSITRTNPVGGMMSKFSDVTGHSIKEAGGLALGGLAYGAVNSLMTKIPGVNKVQEQLVKVPVIGTSLPTLLMGVALNLIGSKMKNKAAKDALEIAGSGLVGASIVGMGVNASQLIPGLKPAALSGINYTMNGVQYSPSMNGVDFTMNGGQLGNDADFGSVGDADFGGVPSGMGYDVMDDDSDENSEDFEGVPSGMN